MHSVGIVLINYFNDDEVISFIRNYLLSQTNKSTRIFVLNNGSDKDSLKKYCEQQSSIQYEDPGKNLGYIGGFLHVLKLIKGQKPELLILSNTDIEIEPTLLESLSKFNLQNDEVMIGPSVISSRTGKQQNPFYEQRISTAKLKVLNVAFSSYFSYLIYQLLGIMKAMFKGATDSSNQQQRHVYAIHGSFMIFKTEFLERCISELEDAPFLFGEEIQFAEVAFKYKLKTLYCPAFKVKHHEHTTTKLFKSKRNLKFLKDSIAFRLNKREEAGDE
jgi:GT2 family glycosyltransferase